MANLRRAVALLSAPEVAVEAVAPVYETEPVGVEDQPWFLNTVVRIETTLGPRQLLETARSIEAEVGRTPTFRWGPREIDVDILLYGDALVSEHDLVIPHPRMADRLFVLLPLRDVHPGWRDARGRSIDEVIESLRGTAAIQPYHEAV